MAREYGRIRVSIADDEDLEELTTDAQWLYFRVMIPDPTLNYAGVGDWRPARLLRKAVDMTMPRLLAAAAELERTRYALFDTDTEEFLCRALIRSDELLKNPKMVPGVATAYSRTASNQLRAAIVTEVQKIKADHPEYSSWTHKDTAEILGKLVSRKNLETVGYSNSIPVPDTYPIPVPDTHPPANPIATGYLSGFDADPLTPNSPTTTTSPNTQLASLAASARESRHDRIPDTWQPSDTHRAKARTMNVDVEFEADQFRNHALSTDRLSANWNAAFHSWLGRSKPRANPGQSTADQRVAQAQATKSRFATNDAASIFGELT